MKTDFTMTSGIPSGVIRLENGGIIKGRCISIESYYNKANRFSIELIRENADNNDNSVLPDIKKVIFNRPATIVLWDDNTKTVTKCSENDKFDPEKGLMACITKKALGNKGNYYNTIRKYVDEYYIKNHSDKCTINDLYTGNRPIIDEECINKAFSNFSESIRKCVNDILDKNAFGGSK